MVLEYVKNWFTALLGLGSGGRQSWEFYEGEVADLEFRLRGITCLADVKREFGQPDSEPSEVSNTGSSGSVRYMVKIHRYWRYWKSLAVDFGEWNDDGSFAVVYYPQGGSFPQH